MEKPKRRITQRGIGESGLRPKHATVPPPSGTHNKQGDPGVDAPISAGRPEKMSTRPPRSLRRPIRVDDVGDAAVAIAQKVVRHAVPKVIKRADELPGAPITHRDAFLLSLIDGRLTVQALVDVSGMPEAQMMTILERLARLGIVTLS
ncbi:MAG: hypothetical protein KF819_31970 [Labilithrix sp.]|nr:hypothetical protein [Labilithrix sp.]